MGVIYDDNQAGTISWLLALSINCIACRLSESAPSISAQICFATYGSLKYLKAFSFLCSIMRCLMKTRRTSNKKQRRKNFSLQKFLLLYFPYVLLKHSTAAQCIKSFKSQDILATQLSAQILADVRAQASFVKRCIIKNRKCKSLQILQLAVGCK